MFSLEKVTLDGLWKLSWLVSETDTEWYIPSQEVTLLKSHIQKWNARFLLYKKEYVWCIVTMHEPLSTQIRCVVSKQKWWGRFMMDTVESECIKKWDKKLRCWSRDVLKANWFYEKMWFWEQFLIEKFEFGKDCRFFWKTLS